MTDSELAIKNMIGNAIYLFKLGMFDKSTFELYRAKIQDMRMYQCSKNKAINKLRGLLNGK